MRRLPSLLSSAFKSRASALQSTRVPWQRRHYDDEIEEDGQDGEDVIESLVAMRIKPSNGKVQFRVHWKGTTEEEDEWFFREDLVEEPQYSEMVRSFEYEDQRQGVPQQQQRAR